MPAKAEWLRGHWAVFFSQLWSISGVNFRSLGDQDGSEGADGGPAGGFVCTVGCIRVGHNLECDERRDQSGSLRGQSGSLMGQSG